MRFSSGEPASKFVGLKRIGVEISLERPVRAARGEVSGIARLSVRFEPGAGGEGPSSKELGEALEQLDRELQEAVEAVAGLRHPGPDRQLTELIETYHPRQIELVELLLADHEVTESEADSLRRYVHSSSEPRPTQPTVSKRAERVPQERIAVPSTSTDRIPPSPRPVPELLDQYRIESLKQAGAVRARREISFAEYMALKRHFAEKSSTD